ncbi:MAG: hypothetical protein ACKPEY_12060 [Planctomycetota bacterium]
MNLENQCFWRLHGWIESRWTAFRALQHLSDQDPAFQHALQQEKQHLAGHMHPVLAPLHALSLAKPSTTSARR